jgi:hypothetical protein
MPGSVNLDDFSALTIRNKGNLAVDADDTLDFSTATINGEGKGEAFITIVSPAGVSFPASFSIAGYTLNVDGLSSVTGNWTVASNGALSHSRNGSTEAHTINLTIHGNLTVDTGGEINGLQPLDLG